MKNMIILIMASMQTNIFIDTLKLIFAISVVMAMVTVMMISDGEALSASILCPLETGPGDNHRHDHEDLLDNFDDGKHAN